MQHEKIEKRIARAILRMIEAAKELVEIENQSKRRTRKAAGKGADNEPKE